jgi:hypothetical protein
MSFGGRRHGRCESKCPELHGGMCSPVRVAVRSVCFFHIVFILRMTMIMNTVARSISSIKGSSSFHVCTINSQHYITLKLMPDYFLYNKHKAWEFRIVCILLTKKSCASLTNCIFVRDTSDRQGLPNILTYLSDILDYPTKQSFGLVAHGRFLRNFSSFMITFKSHSTLFDLCSCSSVEKLRENH